MMIIRRWIALLLVIIGCVGSSVLAGNFSLAKDWHHVGFHERTYTVKGEMNDTITFKVKGNAYYSSIQLISSRKDIPVLRLPYPEGLNMAPIDFYIKELRDTTSGKRFWVVTSREGNKVIGYGFWIVGEYKGTYVVYVSEQSMRNMGWNRPLHKSSRNYIGVVDGDLYIRLTKVHIDFNLPTYMTWTDEDPVTVRLFWDNTANWFGMVSDGATIPKAEIETRYY